MSLNGNFYGKLGDKYNYQFDPLQKYRVTIKCQLDILWYTQLLLDNIPDIEIISGNTDGIVAMYNKDYIPKIDEINKYWSSITGIEMEKTTYKKLIQKDINNYIAVKTDGKVKYKGIFERELELHKDSSSYIVTLALTEYFVNNIPIEETIMNNDDIFNFLNTIRVQNTGKGRYELFQTFIKDGKEQKIKLQKLNRYYVCNNPNYTIIKEKNEGESFAFIEAGYNVKELNKVIDKNAKNYDINYNYYLKKARDIITKIEDKQLKLF